MITKLIIPVAFAAVISILTAGTFASCTKSCYDPALKAAHENDICTADCPGVTGCDGNHYCNECEANKKGITIRP